MANTIVYPEIPSPQTKEDYESLIQSMFAAVLSEENNRCTLDAMKVTGTIPATVKDIQEKLWNLEMRKRYEKDLAEAEVIEKISPDIEVIKTRYAAPFPISDRQFILLRSTIEKDGVVFILTFSINHKAAVENKDVVLGVSRFNVSIIRPAVNPKHSVITRITQLDPKGSIPKFAVNMSKSKLADFMVTLRKASVRAQ